MNKHTITLALIVKNEENKIKNALDSIAPFVDEICITDTGSTDKTKFVLQNLPYSDKIKITDFNPTTNPEAFFEDGAIYNFAAARTFNFSQATCEWTLWMDADDILQGQQNLQQLTEVAEQNKIDAYYFRYHYQLKDGHPVETHWKLQFIKNNGHGHWLGRVHEDYLPNGKSVVRYAKTDAMQRVHVMGDATDPKKHERNLRILTKELQEQGDNPDPRTLFYTARAFITIGNNQDAIPLLEKYSELSGFQEELYEGLYLLAESYNDIKEFDKARATSFKAISMKPHYPDCYYTVARAYLAEQDFEKAIEWLNTGFSKKIPPDPITTFPQRYTTQPLALYATACMYQGKLDEALKAIEKAIQSSPNDKHLQFIKDTISFVKRRKEVSESYVNITSFLMDKKDTWKIRTLLGTIPAELEANPLIAKLKFDWFRPATWPKKSVAILAFGSVEAWSPKNEKQGGIGGSEEAVINLSRELKKLGWKVTVYTNTGDQDGVYDGVVWKMYTEFNGKDEFDALVLWRAPGLLDYELKARKKLFDMHDVPQPGDWAGDHPEKVDAIMVKTKYQRSLLPEVKDEKFQIVPNGINPAHFNKPKKPKREEFRCFYSSAIDRGLDVLLNLWPKIKAQVPEATLHIYYGFQTFKALNKDNPERMRYVDGIEKKMNDMSSLGVTYHGRVDHETLALEMMKSDAWLYPTYFPEISCITAMKAQAAGAIPVCTDFAALDETVQFGKKISGDIYLPEVQEEYIKTVVEVLKDKNYKEETRKAMMPWAQKTFGWAEVAKQWDSVLS